MKLWVALNNSDVDRQYQRKQFCKYYYILISNIRFFSHFKAIIFQDSTLFIFERVFVQGTRMRT